MRYNRQIILSEIGPVGQEKISKTKVLVVGAGGLGCPILQYLTAAGIGTIGIIDFDVVEASNLQRQVLFGTSSLGQNKAEAAKKRLEDLNNTIKIQAYPYKLNYQNALDLFHLYDIIVDGSDNFETRYLVNDACILTNKPLVYGAIFKFEGQVSVFNYQNGASYRCLFPNKPKKEAVPNCSQLGVLGVLPGIIGSMQANEVLKIILGIGTVLSGKLLCFNALTNETSILKIAKSEKTIFAVLNAKDEFHKTHLNVDCKTAPTSISINDVFNKKNIQFIDVREADELPKIDLFDVVEIPLGELEHRLDKISLEKETYCFCQSGTRSEQAVAILRKHNITNCYNIQEGASEIIQSLKV
jgi:adenylyltransferase/sulfurtransferase